MTLIASSLVLVKCIFEDNVGTGMINAENSNITIAQSTFKDNYVGSNINFEMFTIIYCNITIVRSTFIDNDGRLLSVRNYKDVNVVTSVIPLVSTLTITGCELRNNYQSTGDNIFSRMIDVRNSDILLIFDTKFISNNITKTLYVEESVINTDNCTFKYNHSLAMLLKNCTVSIFNSVFKNNEAGAIRLWDTKIHIHGSEFKENVERRSGWGGAIYSSGETLISFSEVCMFADNQAEKGGKLYLDQSVQCFIAHGATVIIANNTASADGGGIYLSRHANITLHSQSTLIILENRATENGGGIYVSQFSSINLGFKSLNNIYQTSSSTIYFYRNQARQGGGLYVGYNLHSLVLAISLTLIKIRLIMEELSMCLLNYLCNTILIKNPSFSLSKIHHKGTTLLVKL